MAESTVSRFYSQMADWWPLMSAVADYEEEAGFYTRLLRQAGTAPAETLLELGSGGGNNAAFMKRRFDMTLVEPADGMPSAEVVAAAATAVAPSAERFIFTRLRGGGGAFGLRHFAT